MRNPETPARPFCRTREDRIGRSSGATDGHERRMVGVTRRAHGDAGRARQRGGDGAGREAGRRRVKGNPKIRAALVDSRVNIIGRMDWCYVNPRSKLESVAYAVFPNISYFEFLPLRENHNEQELDNVDSKFHRELDPVGLTEVEVGCLYEVIITNFAGIYRYKLGNIVKVVSYHNSKPVLQFIRRRNNVLSINIDKNTENDIQMAINEASHLLALHKLEIVDFTTHADSSSDPGHYVIFMELSRDASQDILNSCSSCLDLAFVEIAYVWSRRNNIVGPLELRVVCRGTFRKILEHYADVGTTMSQFKMPRCVGSSNDKLLKILCRNVVRAILAPHMVKG
ncbi:uncharacterized protein A4U43_C01F2410 [Asparagus officinalis]|uniref:Uncharacterized protein n=1 Tax=Asparagus officinalis TaxID=4686 RepID=A0A5P1FLP0_ASPOF|nr:uncharacterized protein A4U43_C01F2410 [Asparagus officinalis]